VFATLVEPSKVTSVPVKFRLASTSGTVIATGMITLVMAVLRPPLLGRGGGGLSSRK
jgi:hypothetical protein